MSLRSPLTTRRRSVVLVTVLLVPLAMVAGGCGGSPVPDPGGGSAPPVTVPSSSAVPSSAPVQATPAADDVDPDVPTPHPAFTAHFTDPLYTDEGDEFAPFGSDEGADTLAMWSDRRQDLDPCTTVRWMLEQDDAGDLLDGADNGPDVDGFVIGAGFALLLFTGHIDTEGKEGVLRALTRTYAYYAKHRPRETAVMIRDLKPSRPPIARPDLGCRRAMRVPPAVGGPQSIMAAMTATIAHVSISLDGFVAGPDQSPDNPIGIGGLTLHRWHFQADEPGHEASVPWRDELLERGDAFVMGRNMFAPGRGPWDESWLGWWGDEPPYHAPVFVLTHYPRDPVELEGTTFFFVTEGFEAAWAQARAAAGDGVVDIAGGASTVRQALQTGVLDELVLDIAPVLLGRGERLLDGVTDPGLLPIEVVGTPWATHVRYRVGG